MAKVTDRRGQDRSEKEIKIPKLEDLKETFEVPDPPVYDEINLAMMGERLLIQNFPVAKKIGSIFTPDNREVDINRGRICGIGPDVKNKNIKLGEVYFKVYGLGQTLIDNKGNKYIFLPENAVISRDKDYDGNVKPPAEEIFVCNLTKCEFYGEEEQSGPVLNHCLQHSEVEKCGQWRKEYGEKKPETITE